MDINISPIRDDLPSISFNLFRKWIENAKKVYTSYDLRISDERVLVDDLKKVIEGSVISLFEREKGADRQVSGRGIGFIQGYIEGNLNEHWHHEYISKQGDDYKQIIALQAIQNYLESEELTKIKINHAYKDLLSKDINLSKLQTNIKKYDVDFDELKYDISEELSENIEVVSTCLENLITGMIFNLVKGETQNFMPEISLYFDDKRIEELIKMNEHVQ